MLDTSLLADSPIANPFTDFLALNPEGLRILSLLNHDAAFAEVAQPIILNEIDYTKPNYAEELTQRLYSRASDLDFTASCSCGHITGNTYIGIICPSCHDPVVSDMEAGNGNLTHQVWLKAPAQIPGFIHPIAYLILSRWLRFGRKSTSYLDVILDAKAPLPPELEGEVTGRGFIYLYQNFDRLMDYFQHHHKATSKKPMTAHIGLWLAMNRHLIFCRHLPVLASALHPIIAADNSPKSRRTVDPASEHVLKAAISLSHITFTPNKPRHIEYTERIVYEAYKNFITYIQDIIQRRLSKKKSLPRMHLLGARFHWSFRSVITPITGAQEYDELHIPWCIGVNTYKIHIISRLMHRYGHTGAEAAERQANAILAKDELIGQIMKDLISEYPASVAGRRGLPTLFNRNPSLKRGSIQLLNVRRVKDDLNDGTISMSNLVLSAPNADNRVCIQLNYPRPTLAGRRTHESMRLCSHRSPASRATRSAPTAWSAVAMSSPPAISPLRAIG